MNAENIDKTQSPEQHEGLSAIGRQLAAARREQSRELASVASDLHLRAEVLSALENGDKKALPSATFLRGYIKSYARLLGLNEVQLLAMLPTTEEYRPAPLKAVGMRRRGLDFPLGKWLLRLIALAVLAGVLVYAVPVVEHLLTRAEQVVEPDTLALPSNAAPGDEGQALPIAPELQEPPLDEIGSEAPPPEEVGVEEPDTAAPAPLTALPGEPATGAAEEAQGGPALLVLRFREDSWVEMESHGRKLVVGVQPAGSERTIRAEPPVQLLLGNAPGVSLEYRGKIVDLKPHQRGKVARLVLEN